MLIRLYINNFDSDQIWSTDFGDVSTEQHWHGIQCRVAVNTHEDMAKRGSKTEPCCWLQAQGVLRQLELGDGLRWAVIE